MKRKKKNPLDQEIIYFIKNTGNQYIKIGFTKDLDFRLSSLQGANADKLIIWGILYVSATRSVFWERAIHDNLKEYRVRGEWFNVPESILKQTYNVYYNLIGRYR
jgi:hypothetical protein